MSHKAESKLVRLVKDLIFVFRCMRTDIRGLESALAVLRTSSGSATEHRMYAVRILRACLLRAIIARFPIGSCIESPRTVIVVGYKYQEGAEDSVFLVVTPVYPIDGDSWTLMNPLQLSLSV